MDWAVGESSTNSRDHSGMYPPSMYDTSVSSKSSASRRSPHFPRGSPPPTRYSQQSQQQLHQQPAPSTRDYYHKERPVVVYPSRSMDNSYEYSPRYRSAAAMSDPGGPPVPSTPKLMETQSDIGYSPTNTHSSSTHQYHHSNSFATTTSSQETRPAGVGGRGRGGYQHARYHSYGGAGNNTSISTRSSSLRSQSFRSDRNVLMPPKVLQPQLSASGSFGSSSRQSQSHQQQQQPLHSRPPHGRSSSHAPSLYHLEDQELARHHHAHNLHPNDSDINSSARIETPPPVNVKELKRQLWNEHEILQVPSSLERNTDYVSDSEYGQQRRPQPKITSDSSPDRRALTKQQTAFANSRYARSLSPGRRQYSDNNNNNNNNNDNNQSSPDRQPHMVPYASSTVSDSSGRFHSKFYEAALAARMRSKVVVPSSGSVHSRPFDERSHKTDASPLVIQRVVSTDARHSRDPTSTLQKRHSFHEAPPPQLRQEPVEVPGTRDLPEHQQPPPPLQRDRYEGVQHRGRSMDPPLRRTRMPSPMIQDRIRSLSQDPQRQEGYHSTFSSASRNEYRNGSSPPNDPRNESYEATIGRFGSLDDGSKQTTSHGPPAMAETNCEYHEAAVPNEQQEFSSLRYSNEGFGSKLAASAMESSKERMAQLMARLNSVSRENPEVALAQIDQILRQESQTSSPARKNAEGSPQQHEIAMTAPIPPFPTKNDPTGEEDDDDSDVSSITNPTYQGTISSKPYYERVRVVSPQEFHPTIKNLSPTHENEITSPKIPFNPSTSSFRRPRPSYLRNYTTSAVSSHHIATSELCPVDRPDPLPQQPVNDFQRPPVTNVNESHISSDFFPENPFDDFILPEESAPQKPPSQPQKPPSQPQKPPSPSPMPQQEHPKKHDPLPEESIPYQTKIEVSLAKTSPTPSAKAPPEPVSDKEPIADSGGKQGKLDKFISDKEALARKIQAWDSLSNSLVISEPEKKTEQIQVGFPNQNTLALPRPPTSSSRRHPWEGRLPSRLESIRMRDTSMDEAIGIETEMTFRGIRHERTETESPQVSASIDTSVPEGNHFKQAGENIRNRAEDYLPVDPVYHIDEKVVEEKKVADEEAMRFPDIPLESIHSNDIPKEVTSENKKLMRNVTKSPEGVYQFSPSNQPYTRSSSPQGLETEISEEETSWVSLPKTSFFSEFKTLNPFAENNANQKKTPPEHVPPSASPPPPQESGVSSQPTARVRARSQVTETSKTATEAHPVRMNRDGPPNSGPVDVDDYTFGVSPSPSVDQSGEQAEIEVALTDPKKYIGNHSGDHSNGVAMSRTGARSLACQTVPNKEVARTKEKKKGFLRAFIERKKMKSGGGATVGHAASVAAQSTSLESRGAKSASQLEMSNRPTPSTPVTPSINLIPPPPGVMDRRALTPSRGRRGYRSNPKTSTRRARSNSLERFRTPSMAQKFNRVMKLYDDDT